MCIIKLRCALTWLKHSNMVALLAGMSACMLSWSCGSRMRMSVSASRQVHLQQPQGQELAMLQQPPWIRVAA